MEYPVHGLRRLLVENNDLSAIVVRERPKQYPIHHAEKGVVHTNSERER
jgi:hypothetical protein